MKLERQDYKNEMVEQGRSLKKKNKELKEAFSLLLGIILVIALLHIFY